MAITADDVKRLRELSGAGVMDCKRALEEAGGNVEKAAQVLRERGIALAEKKSSRAASQGLVESYIHAGGRIGVIVEVNCETDFVARTDTFRELAHDIAMQIAATNPVAVTEADLPTSADGSDPADVVLLRQPFIKDPGRSMAEVVRDAIARTGENIVVRRFARFELGGGGD
ncbi:MAG: translation elongation factor Ts [Dehalococcoidia bacterium]|nr:translation elongation factor Ts [Dehalococcoidia bacterium]